MNIQSEVNLPPTKAALLTRAQALVPIVRERAGDAEKLHRLHDETFAELTEAKFGHICAPTRFGGYNLGLDVAAEVVMEIGRGCGSTAWITNLMTLHNFQASMFSLQAQEDYFANGVPYCSTAFRSIYSSVTEVEGGLRLSGRWKFASGSDFADWFIIMRPSETFTDWLMVSRSDVTLQADWNVAGLAATGSQDIILDDVFVPSYRRLAFSDVATGTTPGRELSDDPFLRVPFFNHVGIGISAAVVGIVTGLVEEFEKASATRKNVYGVKSSLLGYNQSMLAEAAVRISCARNLVLGAASRVRAWGEDGLPEDPSELCIPRRDYSYAAKLMTQTAQELYTASGAGAAFLSNPIQRFARDAFVGGTHASLIWDDAAEAYGRARWKVPDPQY